MHNYFLNPKKYKIYSLDCFLKKKIFYKVSENKGFRVNSSLWRLWSSGIFFIFIFCSMSNSRLDIKVSLAVHEILVKQKGQFSEHIRVWEPFTFILRATSNANYTRMSHKSNINKYEYYVNPSLRIIFLFVVYCLQ